MNILISGTSGLIGSALMEDLRADGHEVARLTRTGTLATKTPGVIDVPWDPERHWLDVDALSDAGPFDGVVHLAGAGIGDHRWSPSRKEAILASRTASTSLLVEALLPRPPAVFVSASAVGYYGDTGDRAVDEQSPAGSGFLADVCVAWERSGRPALEAGIRTVFLRTGIVLAPTGGALGKQLPLFRLGLGGKMGTGRQYRSWISLKDEVAVIRRILDDQSLNGPVNATAPAPATDAELARHLGAALHRPAVLPVPATALKVALGSEMAQEMILSGQRVLPAALQASGYDFIHPDLDSALEWVVNSR